MTQWTQRIQALHSGLPVERGFDLEEVGSGSWELFLSLVLISTPPSNSKQMPSKVSSAMMGGPPEEGFQISWWLLSPGPACYSPLCQHPNFFTHCLCASEATEIQAGVCGSAGRVFT